MVINVYSQYFQAQASFSGVERRGALVLLISDSEAGMISYKAAVSFFPHRDAEDFGVSYDAYFEKEIYNVHISKNATVRLWTAGINMPPRLFPSTASRMKTTLWVHP